MTSSTDTSAARRTSLQCSASTSSATARSKPPPPVRRTSSVTGTSSPMMRSPTSDTRQLASSPTSVFPGGVPSSPGPRSIGGGGGQRTSPRHMVRVSPAPRRSLSSAYADLCQTLNDQLAAGGGDAGPRRQRASVADAPASTSSTAATPRRQSSGNVGGSRGKPRNTDSLLMDIKRGVCLRPTVCNDRSSPSIHRT